LHCILNSGPCLLGRHSHLLSHSASPAVLYSKPSQLDILSCSCISVFAFLPPWLT
jgi:hypothetical protein